MNKRGITLMELVIVMVIIAIGAVLMVPNLGSWLPHYRLRSAARDVVSSMRSAQMKAVASNVVYQVSFTGNNTFTIMRQTTAGVNNYVADSDDQILPSGITFVTDFPLDAMTGKRNAAFNPNSTASSGNVFLTSPRNETKTITVLSTTGRVRISP